MGKPTFGSLFAGIGGIDLGLERVGWQCQWQVEWDSFCTKILEKHWPNVRRYGDVKDCGKHNLEPVELICGGFPCQPHSVAGKRRGKEDDRNLWPEFLRIVRELRPTWILAENVPGIVSLYLDTVLSDLEGEGYTCWTFNIPACAFNAPHRRARIFVVAHTERNEYHGEKPRSIGEETGVSEEYWAEDDTARRTGRAGGIRLPSTGDVADTQGQPSNTGYRQGGITTEGQPRRYSGSDGGAWAVEPDVGRVAYGVPNRVDRLRTLGNAVVPQVAEWLGCQILAAYGINGWLRHQP